MKPILSRFCEIYVPEPVHNNVNINLYKYNLNETFKLKDVKTIRMEWLKKELQKVFSKEKSNDNKKPKEKSKEKTKEKSKEETNDILIQLSNNLYEKAYSGLDIIQLLETHSQFLNLTNGKRYELLFAFNKVKKEFRNDKLLIMFILNFLFISLDFNLENITFM
jgi:hypothetical protein